MLIPTVSICTPTFELGGRAIPMLTKLFESVEQQTFKDFELVVSDHSDNDAVLSLCTMWRSRIPVVYHQNDKKRGSCEANLNNAVMLARGKFIKPLLQDDFFLAPHALARLVETLPDDRSWSAGGCLHCREDNTTDLFHPHSPRWVDGLALPLGENRIGSPSVVLYPRDVQNRFFDENLPYHMDCEMYYRLSSEIGPAICIPEHLHCIRFRHDSISDSEITDAIRGDEFGYILAKHRDDPKPLEEFPVLYERSKRLGIV